ncbi:hypothetical protein MT418_000927 [Batrachochytrium dendrobatidis]
MLDTPAHFPASDPTQAEGDASDLDEEELIAGFEDNANANQLQPIQTDQPLRPKSSPAIRNYPTISKNRPASSPLAKPFQPTPSASQDIANLKTRTTLPSRPHCPPHPLSGQCSPTQPHRKPKPQHTFQDKNLAHSTDGHDYSSRERTHPGTSETYSNASVFSSITSVEMHNTLWPLNKSHDSDENTTAFYSEFNTDADQPDSLTWSPPESPLRTTASARTCPINAFEEKEALTYLDQTVFPTLLKAIESVLKLVKMGKDVADPIGMIALNITKNNPRLALGQPNGYVKSKFLESAIQRMEEPCTAIANQSILSFSLSRQQTFRTSSASSVRSRATSRQSSIAEPNNMVKNSIKVVPQEIFVQNKLTL